MLLIPPVVLVANPGSDIRIDLIEILFKPKRIEAAPGDRLVFINKDPFEHTVNVVDAADPNRVIFPDTAIQEGEEIVLTITEKGVFILYCTIHGGMKGMITTSGSFELPESVMAGKSKSLPPEAKAGEELFWAKAQCHQCHTMGTRGTSRRGPNLEDIGFRSGSRARELNLSSPTAYLTQSLLDPSAYIVPGYVDDMEKVYQPPLDLSVEELTAIIAFLQSQGGAVDTWAIDIPQDVIESPIPWTPWMEGNPEAGEAVFFERAKCGSCHRVAERGGGVGPDLTHIGAYRSAAFLTQEVLEPNAVLAPGWELVTVKLTSGQSISAALQQETADSVTVLVGENDVREFARSEVERVIHRKRSKMPDYSGLLTVKEVADLIAYLQSLR